MGQLKHWSDGRGWLSEINEKTISEERIGTYTVHGMVIKTPQGAISIDPVGRDIIGAEGRVDITAFPSFDRMLLVKINSEWVVKTDAKIRWPNPWGKSTFYEIVDALWVRKMRGIHAMPSHAAGCIPSVSVLRFQSSAIQADVLRNAHCVREYRNLLVHGDPVKGVCPGGPISLAEARKYLCHYLSNLPRQW